MSETAKFWTFMLVGWTLAAIGSFELNGTYVGRLCLVVSGVCFGYAIFKK